MQSTRLDEWVNCNLITERVLGISRVLLISPIGYTYEFYPLFSLVGGGEGGVFVSVLFSEVVLFFYFLRI